MSFDHTPEAQARRAEELYESLRDASEKDVLALADLLATKPDDPLFGATASQARNLSHRPAARAFQDAAEQRKKEGMYVPAPPAPGRGPARSKGYRAKGLLSALGSLRIERGCYHCRGCGHYSADVVFGLDDGEPTVGAAELVSLAGVPKASPAPPTSFCPGGAAHRGRRRRGRLGRRGQDPLRRPFHLGQPPQGGLIATHL